MTPEGSTHIAQTICMVGLLPFLLLGGLWILGCLRALWYFIRWHRAQSLSTRWLTVAIPLVPLVVLLLGALLEHTPGNLTSCGVTFTLLFAIVIVGVGFVGGALHSFTVAEGIAEASKRTRKWQQVVLIGVLLDLLTFWILRW